MSSLASWMEPDSRRSSDGILLQLKSGMKFGSRRSPDGAYQQLELVTEPSSRRSPGRVLLAVEVGNESGRSLPAVEIRCEVRLP